VSQSLSGCAREFGPETQQCTAWVYVGNWLPWRCEDHGPRCLVFSGLKPRPVFLAPFGSRLRLALGLGSCDALAMTRSLKVRRVFFLAVPLVLSAVTGPSHCKAPTQLRLTVESTLPCSELKDIAIDVGSDPEKAGISAEGKSPFATSRDCTPLGENRYGFGNIILFPGTETGAVVVRGGVGVPAENCNKDNPDNCIFARRSFRFVSSTTLELVVTLDAECKGKFCETRGSCIKNQGCVQFSTDCEGLDCKPPPRASSTSGTPDASNGGTTSSSSGSSSSGVMSSSSSSTSSSSSSSGMMSSSSSGSASSSSSGMMSSSSGSSSGSSSSSSGSPPDAGSTSGQMSDGGLLPGATCGKGIACGNGAKCQQGEFCCDQYSNPMPNPPTMCLPYGGGLTTMCSAKLCCRKSADCGAGETCCVTNQNSGPTTACSNSCGGRTVACETNADCPANEFCGGGGPYLICLRMGGPPPPP
jgi:hypothetical protein